jgi:hypothetical protein
MNYVLRTAGLALVGLSALGLSGCGGGSSDGDSVSSDSATSTGAFVDSAVSGVSYKTATQSGVTDADGHYDYLQGETVTFSMGGVIFPAVTATGTVTPFDMAGTNDIEDDSVINIARLLQTLDDDGDAANGIQITETTRTALGDLGVSSFNKSQAAFVEVFANAPLMLSDSNNWKTEESAKAHLNQANPIVGTWLHNIPDSGTVYLKLDADNNYMVISNSDSNVMQQGTYVYDAVNDKVDFTYVVGDAESELSAFYSTETGDSVGPLGANLSAENNTLTITTAYGPASFSRQITVAAQTKEVASTSSLTWIEGIWQMDGTSGTTIFVFNRDYSYFVFSQYDTPTFEKGIYTLADNTNDAAGTHFAFTATPTVDSNDGKGFSGMAGAISFVKNENDVDSLTLKNGDNPNDLHRF